MEKEKICFSCEQYENPYEGHDGSSDNPENFITISWIGQNETDDAHDECWYIEK